jgi:hypothetical protein
MELVARTWYLALQKFIVFLSLVSGLVLIGACTYTAIKVHKGSPIIQNGTENGTSPSPAYTSILDENNLAEPLRKVIFACAAVGFVAGMFQCMVSLCNLFSCSKNAGTNTKIWLIVHALIFIALFVCILLPFNFEKESGDAHGVKEMWKSTKDNLGKAIKFENINKDVMGTYFIVLILDEALILCLMILNCCFMRCGMQEYENLDENPSEAKHYR